MFSLETTKVLLCPLPRAGGLLNECDALDADTTLITPLAETRFRIIDVQEPRIIIELVDSEDSQPLQREQLERSPNASLVPAAPSTLSASRQMKTRMRPCSVCIPLRDRRPGRHAHRKQPQLWSLLEELLASRKRIAPQL